MTPRPSVSAEDLERWADRHEAAAVLPELVRRLLLATVAVRELEMRAGKAVHLKGFDGVVIAREETAFCPEGLSAWELSTRADVKTKLDEDYRERGDAPGAAEPRSVAFMLVTARRFPGKARWIERSNADRRWRRVRVLDADDLSTWLGQAPLVAAWFSHVHLEKPAYDLWDAESYLRRWSRQTRPALPPSLVLEGREVERRRFEEWLEQIEAGHGVRVLRIVASSRDEARILALAVLHGLPSARRSVWLARCTVVETAEAWRWAVHQPGSEPWLLIPAFDDDAMVTGTTDRWAYAVLPLDRSATNREGIELRDPLPWRVVEATLRRLSVAPAEAERIARETQGDLPALRQRLELDGAPAWIDSVESSALVAMMLVGAWVPSNETDARMIERLGVQPDNLDQACGKLRYEEEAPIERDDAAWRWKSHANAWDLLHDSLTPSRQQSFVEIAIDVLTGGMPTDDVLRLHRTRMSCSSAMEAGVAASLGYLSQRTKEGRRGDQAANTVTRQVLRPTVANWMRLTNVLSDLAEAAPRTFIEALENALAADGQGFSQWMSDEKASSAWRLLHALQTLAWDQNLVAEVSLLLMKLAACVDADRSEQRALSSLYAIHNLYHPQTRLPDDARVQVLRAVVDADEHRGWQLLIDLVPGPEGGVVQPSPMPRLMPLEGIPTEPSPLAVADLARRIESLTEIVIEKAGTDPRKWRDVLTKRVHRSFPPTAWQPLVCALRDRRMAIIEADSAAVVWAALRNALSDMCWLQERDRRATEAVAEHYRSRLTELDDLYHSFEPSDPVIRDKWLFYNRDTFPDARIKQDWESVQPILKQRREESLQRLIATPEGIENVTRLIALLANGENRDAASVALENLAKALACSAFRQEFEAAYLYDDPGERARALASHLARQVYFFARGRDLAWLEDLMRRWVTSNRAEDALATIGHIYAPEIWDLLDRLGDPLRTKYWQSREFVPGDDADDWERVVKNLLAAGNVSAALHTSSFRAQHLATSTLVEALRAAGRTARRSTAVETGAHHYHDIEELFSTLDARSDCVEPPDELAALELDLLQWLDSHFSSRGLRYIPAQLEANVEYFVDLIRRAYAPEDTTDPPDAGEAERARHALHMWKSYPGSTLSDPEAHDRVLFDWATEALQRTAEARRARAGLTEVAEVLARPERGEDGHWPSLAARRLLESRRYRDLGRILRDIKGRSRAAWWLADGGRTEHDLADRHETSATALRARWPATATMLDELATQHRREALRRDEEARRERLASGRPTSTASTPETPTDEHPMNPDTPNGAAPPSAIRKVEVVDVGPSAYLSIELTPRVNLVAGDNGVGKTFVLDVLWWCLTGTWSGHPAWPSLEAREREPKILVTDATGEVSPSVFDRTNEAWPRPTGWPPTLAPVLYVRLDGRFSLWDPLRNRGTGASAAYHFDSLWDRLVDDAGTVLCNGLIDDWRDWSQRDDKSLFEKFFGVVKAIMPPGEGPTPDGGPEPSGFVKLSKRSAARVPQVRLRYGDVPIEHLSAGMKRILGIAYLLIWAWDEHIQVARLEGTAPATQIVLLIDEVEAHLHPKWQRMLLPALLGATRGLSEEHLSVQVVATTHSPLVAASLEPHFDLDTDQLLHLGYEGNKVRIKEIPWANHGDASAWLESDAFELERSTSLELERVLEAAEAFLANEADLPPDLDTREKIDRELRRLLAKMDPFWLQWGTPVDEASQ
jgi:hypothetical protein